jgi:excisionase family DNA binding protein
MGNRRVDPRRIKIHFAYSVEEAAAALGTHKNTIRAWIKQGLPVTDDRRPILISGTEIRTFIYARRTAAKRPLRPGEFFCFRCRSAKAPAGGMADFIESQAGLGTLCGICPECETIMHRRASVAKLDIARAHLDVKILLRSAAHKRDPETHSQL